MELEAEAVPARKKVALLVCGALAREVLALRQKHGWDADVLAAPSLLHNHPERIPAAVQQRIHDLRGRYDRMIVVYGDCGTGGLLDAMLAREGVERVAGLHCFEMYADGRYASLIAEAPGTYFLTDYLVQSFDHLVIEGLGLDRHPELRSAYFGNYTRAVYLAQREDPRLRARAKWVAERLGLPLRTIVVGCGLLERRLVDLLRG